MPEPIERSVMKQNIKFMHNRNQFSQEYFHFMKRLSICNTPGQSQYPFESLSVSEKYEKIRKLLNCICQSFLASTLLCVSGFNT